MFRTLGATLLCFWLVVGLGTSSCIAQEERALALVGGAVYVSPTSAPLSDAVVVVSRGTITAIGNRSNVQVPQGARVIDCTGKSLTAGFWNSHVHLTEPAWRGAASATVGLPGLQGIVNSAPLMQTEDQLPAPGERPCRSSPQ